MNEHGNSRQKIKINAILLNLTNKLWVVILVEYPDFFLWGSRSRHISLYSYFHTISIAITMAISTKTPDAASSSLQLCQDPQFWMFPPIPLYVFFLIFIGYQVKVFDFVPLLDERIASYSLMYGTHFNTSNPPTA